MGSSLSKLKKPPFKASRPKMSDSEALQHRISLNRETLARELQRRGYLAAQAAQKPTQKPTDLEQQVYLDQEVYLDQHVYRDQQIYLDQRVYQPEASSSKTNPYYTNTSTHKEEATGTTGTSTTGTGTTAAGPAFARQAPDLNKPLPPLPSAPTTPTSPTGPRTPSTPSPTYTTTTTASSTTSTRTNTNTTATAATTPNNRVSAAYHALQARLLHQHIQEQRARTLQILESRDLAPAAAAAAAATATAMRASPRPALRPLRPLRRPSAGGFRRLPSIIARRRDERAAAMVEGPGQGDDTRVLKKRGGGDAAGELF